MGMQVYILVTCVVSCDFLNTVVIIIHSMYCTYIYIYIYIYINIYIFVDRHNDYMIIHIFIERLPPLPPTPKQTHVGESCVAGYIYWSSVDNLVCFNLGLWVWVLCVCACCVLHDLCTFVWSHVCVVVWLCVYV